MRACISPRFPPRDCGLQRGGRHQRGGGRGEVEGGWGPWAFTSSSAPPPPPPPTPPVRPSMTDWARALAQTQTPALCPTRRTRRTGHAPPPPVPEPTQRPLHGLRPSPHELPWVAPDPHPPGGGTPESNGTVAEQPWIPMTPSPCARAGWKGESAEAGGNATEVDVEGPLPRPATDAGTRKNVPLRPQTKKEK